MRLLSRHLRLKTSVLDGGDFSTKSADKSRLQGGPVTVPVALYQKTSTFWKSLASLLWVFRPI